MLKDKIGVIVDNLVVVTAINYKIKKNKIKII